MTTTNKKLTKACPREHQKKANNFPRQIPQFRVGETTFKSLVADAGEVPIGRVLRRVVEEYLTSKELPIG